MICLAYIFIGYFFEREREQIKLSSDWHLFFFQRDQCYIYFPNLVDCFI